MKSVFIMSHDPGDTLGFDIGRIMDKKPVKGDVGIEIECEGNKFPKHAYKGYDPQDAHLIPSIWGYHRDGSLRGSDNAEYVLKRPIDFNEVADALTSLWSMFEDYGTVLDVSNRTSVHIHLNVQRWHLPRLCTFMAMYFSLEEILTQWCGEHRVGNLFCLRAKDAPGIVSTVKTFLKSNGVSSLPDGLHYAGLNVGAVAKFGSIEIRSLRGCQDPKTILNWVEILRKIYEKSAEFSDPRMLMEDFSGNGPLMYLESILGDKTETLLDGVSMTSQEVQDSIYDGIRMAQDLTYCRDWSLYRPVDTSKDPFGRLAGKTVVTFPDYTNEITQLEPYPIQQKPIKTSASFFGLGDVPAQAVLTNNPFPPGSGPWIHYEELQQQQNIADNEGSDEDEDTVDEPEPDYYPEPDDDF